MPSNHTGDKSFQNNILTRLVLMTAVGFLVLAGLRAVIDSPAEAQSSPANLYIEPATIAIRAPDGGGAMGKMVIDLKTGDVWGFPPINWGLPTQLIPLIASRRPDFEMEERFSGLMSKRKL